MVFVRIFTESVKYYFMSRLERLSTVRVTIMWIEHVHDRRNDLYGYNSYPLLWQKISLTNSEV
jgi:hypothetical protein